MEVIMRANWKKVKEAKAMCEALKELFADELEESREEGTVIGEALGIELAKKVFRFAKENMSICEIAEKCGVSEEKVRMILE